MLVIDLCISFTALIKTKTKVLVLMTKRCNQNVSLNIQSANERENMLKYKISFFH